MQAVPPSSFLLRSIVLATLGLLPLGLMAASAQTSRNRPPAPADANRPASPPASLDMLKERDEELEKLRAEQRRILENEAKLKREEEERKRLELEAKRKREEEERKRLEAEAKRKREEEERQRIEAEARRKREEEERQRIEAEARRKREEDARPREEETVDARRRQEELAWRRHEELVASHGDSYAEFRAELVASHADSYAEFRAEHDEPKGILRLIPIAVWARTENGHTNGEAPAAQEAPAAHDDLHHLIEGLRMPPTVASVSYPRGCRIRRVRVRAPKTTAASGGKRRPVILSRRALRGSRDDATG